MSEISDCISVMVSEETGQISVAVNGEITRGLTEETLLDKLYSELKPSRNSQFWQWKGGDRHSG